MSKTRSSSPKPLEFMQFWLVVAHELGNSRLKINTNARNIHDFLDPNNDAKEYLRVAIKESYKRSYCDHLRSQISIESVLDILGETAFELRSNQRDDLFDIELLEEIAWCISDRYKQYLTIGGIPDSTAKERQKGQLVSFPNYKIRIANARL